MNNSELENMTYIDSQSVRVMLINAYKAIDVTEMWDYMKNDQEHYMFNRDSELRVIMNKMDELGYGGHSGSSFGWTMRQMQFIAINGLEEHRKMYLKQSSCNR